MSFIILFVLALIEVSVTQSSEGNSLRPRNLWPKRSCWQKAPPDDRHPKYDPEFPFLPNDQYMHRMTIIVQDAYSLISGVFEEGFRDSTAYLHYFYPEEFETTNQTFENIFHVVDSGNWDPQLSVDYDCGNIYSQACHRNRRNLAIIPRRQGNIRFCDAFFDGSHEDTRYNLRDKPNTAQEGGWCEKNEGLQRLMVAAASLLQVSHRDRLTGPLHGNCSHKL